MFSFEFCKIFKNTFFIEHLQWLLLYLENHISRNYFGKYLNCFHFIKLLCCTKNEFLIQIDFSTCEQIHKKLRISTKAILKWDFIYCSVLVRHILKNLIFKKVEIKIPWAFPFWTLVKQQLKGWKTAHTLLTLRYTYKYSDNSRVLL